MQTVPAPIAPESHCCRVFVEVRRSLSIDAPFPTLQIYPMNVPFPSASLVKHFLERGVVMPDPGQVYIGPEVEPDAVAKGVVLHPGVRLRGKRLWVGPGCELGAEGPMTVDDCVLEADVRLEGGYASGSLFLRGAVCGSGAHIRPGCMLEEQASCAHSVGLKQTILFPWVTLGSLINFCDVFMAGGTSRSHHSEVGSSFVHFNFTPRGDKATASLFGDVGRGVLLDQPPIFLGGQGGAVGPVRVEYGTVLAAGSVLRQDVETPGMLVMPSRPSHSICVPAPVDETRGLSRKVQRNLEYIGQLHALRAWYLVVRARWWKNCPIPSLAQHILDGAIIERRKRLVHLLELNQRPSDHLEQCMSPPDSATDIPISLHTALSCECPYLQTIQALPPAVREETTLWLARVARDSVGHALQEYLK